MTNELRLGIVGLDTSHAVAFTEILHSASHPWHVPGARVDAAWPGGSPDFELSISRVKGFSDKVREKYGVEILATPEAVAERCDAILLESADGRVHLEQFRRIAPFGKPVFVDKPFACSSDDARRLVELARRHGVPVMSCSPLRYAENLTAALADAGGGAILGADCFGPMDLQPTQPGLFWYGIHIVEMLYAALGRGCREVTAVTNPDYDVVVGRWSDGRLGTVRGNRKRNKHFGGLIHRETTVAGVDVTAQAKPTYASLLERVVKFARDRQEPVPLDETVEIIRFIEAANESRETGGTVTL